MRELEVLNFAQVFNQKSIFLIFLFLYFFAFDASKAQAKIIVIAENDENQIRLLEDDLREKTGLFSFRFNENNEATYDFLEAPQNGSQKMRRAIIGAIEDEFNIFEIRNYSESKEIHFAITDAGSVDLETGITTYEVNFDFADFRNSKNYSDKEALDSFTTGITLFHEIDHKVSYDGKNPMPLFKIRPEVSGGGVLGVVENTNKVRLELGLVLRDTKKVSAKVFRRDIYGITFTDEFGSYKYLRWKMKKR